MFVCRFADQFAHHACAVHSQARVIGSATSKEDEDEDEKATRSETEAVVEPAVRPVMTPALNAEVRLSFHARSHHLR